MAKAEFDGDPEVLSRLELVSLYIDRYYSLDSDSSSRFEAAFKKRKLPLPAMPESPSPDSAGKAGKASSIDRSTFVSYMLLIYTGTALFYSWIYLATRLVKMDFRRNTRHKLIQTGIALLYAIGEILLYAYLSGLE